MGNTSQSQKRNILIDGGNVVPHCSHIMPKKTEEIKVRVEPLIKLSLQQIADENVADLSDVARLAFREFLMRKRGQSQPQSQPNYVNA